MASNPMQRKSRNSFLLGIILTLIITGAIIGLLFAQLKQKNDELKAIEEAKVRVYTLAQDVKAAQILTEDMFQIKTIHRDSVPSNATSVQSVIDTWFLQTKEGETICTDEYGLYLDRGGEDKISDTIIEVRKNEGETIQDFKGKDIQNGEYFVDVNGMKEKVESLNGITQDEYGMFYVDTQGNDKITRVYQEEITGEFYVFKIDTLTMNTGNTKTRVKEYIEIKNVPVLARVDMNANTVITSKLVIQSDERVTDDTREQEYNVVVLPVDLMTNDYIDIRLMTPQGQDFIVVSKAQVNIPMNADGSYIPDTMKINLREDEILTMSSAIVEAAGLKGAKLYATKYVEPAMQEEAYVTYTPNAAVTQQFQAYTTTDMNGDGRITSDDYINLVEEAEQILKARYSEAAKNARNQYLQGLINSIEGDQYINNIEQGTEESITNSLTTRKQYLETLNMGAQ